MPSGVTSPLVEQPQKVSEGTSLANKSCSLMMGRRKPDDRQCRVFSVGMRRDAPAQAVRIRRVAPQNLHAAGIALALDDVDGGIHGEDRAISMRFETSVCHKADAGVKPDERSGNL